MDLDFGCCAGLRRPDGVDAVPAAWDFLTARDSCRTRCRLDPRRATTTVNHRFFSLKRWYASLLRGGSCAASRPRHGGTPATPGSPLSPTSNLDEDNSTEVWKGGEPGFRCLRRSSGCLRYFSSSTQAPLLSNPKDRRPRCGAYEKLPRPTVQRLVDLYLVVPAPQDRHAARSVLLQHIAGRQDTYLREPPMSAPREDPSTRMALARRSRRTQK